MNTDIAKAIRDLAISRQQDINVTATSYMNEAILRRLAASELADQVMLRGGKLWLLEPHDPTVLRPTNDTDIVSINRSFKMGDDSIQTYFEEILRRDMGDGVSFDVIRVNRLTETDGVRVSLQGRIGALEARTELDVGNGAAPPVGARVVDYPCMLDGQAAPFQILAHPWEVSFAEKVCAIIEMGPQLGVKHVHDIDKMIRRIELDPEIAGDCLRWALKSRGLTLEMFEDLGLEESRTQKEFLAYAKRISQAGAPKLTAADYQEITERIQGFLERINAYGMASAPGMRR